MTPKPKEDKNKAARMQESTISQVIVGMLFRLVLKLNIVHSFRKHDRSAKKIRKFAASNNLLDLPTLPQLWHYADLQFLDQSVLVICRFVMWICDLRTGAIFWT